MSGRVNTLARRVARLRALEERTQAALLVALSFVAGAEEAADVTWNRVPVASGCFRDALIGVDDGGAGDGERLALKLDGLVRGGNPDVADDPGADGGCAEEVRGLSSFCPVQNRQIRE